MWSHFSSLSVTHDRTWCLLQWIRGTDCLAVVQVYVRGQRRVAVQRYWLGEGGFFHCGEVQVVLDQGTLETADGLKRRSRQEAVLAVDLLAIVNDLLGRYASTKSSNGPLS